VNELVRESMNYDKHTNLKRFADRKRPLQPSVASSVPGLRTGIREAMEAET
jgi:hypothetical protein